MEVFALPGVTFAGPGTIQLSDGVQTSLGGGMPAGGTYIGPGVTDNGDDTYDFDPDAAGGAGTYTITYTYTDANGCVGSASDDVTVEMMALPANDCSDPHDINPLFGQPSGEAQVSGIYDNTNYTTTAADPATGWECFGEPDGLGGAPSLERTIWYSFTGDGNTYNITTIPCDATNYIGDGDTQMAIYSGDCSDPVAVACNEDDPNADDFRAAVELETEDGVEYLLMIDGFGPDFEQMGEFCVEVTNLTTVSVYATKDKGIHVFPNPTTGQLIIENILPNRIKVLDQFGRIVLEQNDGSPLVNLAEQSSGVYTLLIQLDDDSWASLLVVKK